MRELPQNPLFDIFPQSLDHFNFDKSAIAFAQGDWLARAPNNSFAPLYKYFLGTIYLLFGRNLHIVYFIQFLMGAFSCVLTYWITRDLFGERAGLLAGLGLAMHGPHIIFEGIILREAFISFWGVASLYLLLRLREKFSAGHLIGATLALSAFFQGRPNTMLCLPLVCVFLRQYVFPLQDAEKRAECWGIFSGTLLLSFIPMLTQAYLVHGRFVFFDASGPHTFISGNIIDYSGVGFEHALVENFQKEHKLGYASDISFLIRHIYENPWEFVKLYLRKIYFFFNDFEPPTNISVYLYRELSQVLQSLPNHFAIFATLGLMGMVLAFKQRKTAFLLYAYAVSMAVAVFLFLNEDRYRIPAVPYYIMFSGYTLDRMIHCISRRQVGKSVAMAAIAVILFVALLEPKGVERIRANDYGNVGYAFLQKRNMEKATVFFEKSLSVDPGNVFGRINMGMVYAEKGDFQKAARELTIATKLDPNQRESYFNLGLIYMRAGRLYEAEDFFNKAREPSPGVVSYHLGDLYGRLNRHQDAVAAINKAIRGGYERAEAYYLLGVEHGFLEQHQDAIRAFKKAVEMKPDYVVAYNNLGAIYVKTHRYDLALAAFEAAVRINPDFPQVKGNLEAVRNMIANN